jgi:hypothetical protein
MWTSNSIKRMIFHYLPLNKLFTTRQLLIYGTRSAVDQCLSTLVKEGRIIRLARGVFVREGSRIETISVYDIAKIKAEAFGKQIALWNSQFVVGPGKKRDETTFAVSGSSSSFKFGETTIHLKKTSGRKLILGDTAAGKALRTIWDLGRAIAESGTMSFNTSQMLRTDKEEIRLSIGWLPNWMGKVLLRHHLPKIAYYNFPKIAQPPLLPA